MSDIEKAENFYNGILAFDTIFKMPTALFVSYDNYHHHFGLNIWESAGATKLDKTYEGISGYTITYMDPLLFEKVIANIIKADIVYTEKDSVYILDDPFGIQLRIQRSTP